MHTTQTYKNHSAQQTTNKKEHKRNINKLIINTHKTHQQNHSNRKQHKTQTTNKLKTHARSIQKHEKHTYV